MTILAPSTDYTGAAVTQGGKKTFISTMRTFINDLLGADSGDKEAARLVFGVGGPLGWRQKFIGGNFTDNPWQRGTSFTVSTSGTYTADRWRVDFDGLANITVSKEALATPQVINGVWCRYGLKFLVNSKSGNSYIRLSQRIEGVDTLTTLPSFLQTVIQGSGAFSVPVAARQSFGTGGSPSADVVTSFAANLAVTTSLQQLTTGLTIPSIASKTFGTTIDNFLAVEYDLMAVPAAGYVIIPLAGLEYGTALSSHYEKRAPALELSMCQRFYEKSYNQNITPGTVTPVGQLYTSRGSYVGSDSYYVLFKTRKRATSTVTTYSPFTGASEKVYDYAGAVDLASSILDPSEFGVNIAFSYGATGHQSGIHFTASAEL